MALIGKVPSAPGFAIGGEVGGKWWVENTSGLFRSAHDQDGKDNFAPLYMLKKIRKVGFWDRCSEIPPEPTGDDM